MIHCKFSAIGMRRKQLTTDLRVSNIIRHPTSHVCVHTNIKSLQLPLSLCNSMDCSPPGFSCLEFSRQEYWSGLPFPTPGDLPDPEIEPTCLASPALAGRLFTTRTTWEALGVSWKRIKNHRFMSLSHSPNSVRTRPWSYSFRADRARTQENRRRDLGF